MTLKTKIAIALWEMRGDYGDDWEELTDYNQSIYLEQAVVVIETLTKHFGVY